MRVVLLYYHSIAPCCPSSHTPSKTSVLVLFIIFEGLFQLSGMVARHKLLLANSVVFLIALISIYYVCWLCLSAWVYSAIVFSFISVDVNVLVAKDCQLCFLSVIIIIVSPTSRVHGYINEMSGLNKYLGVSVIRSVVCKGFSVMWVAEESCWMCEGCERRELISSAYVLSM